MYDYVSPQKVMNAFVWLKCNNPSYANIDVNNDWIEQSLANDADLFAGLVKQPDTNSVTNSTDLNTQDHASSDTSHVYTQPHCNPQGGSNDLTAAIDRLRALGKSNCFTIHDVRGDGNCLLNAIAYQLRSFGMTIVAINVLSSELPSIIHILPMNASVEHEVYIGLLLQYHC